VLLFVSLPGIVVGEEQCW